VKSSRRYNGNHSYNNRQGQSLGSIAILFMYIAGAIGANGDGAGGGGGGGGGNGSLDEDGSCVADGSTGGGSEDGSKSSKSAGGMIRNAGQTLDSKSTGGGGGSSRYTMDEVVKNGGWGLPPEAHLALDSGTLCNIPKIRAEDWAGSKGIINDEGSPVILVTANTGGAWSGSGGEDAVNANSEFLEICQRKELLRRYSETEVILSSANTFSYDKRHETLQTYLDDLLNPVTLEHVAGKTWYHFGDNKYEEGEWTNFTEHYIRPQFEYDREPFFSFGIGASGSGVPFHTHGAVFAEVLYGRKRWFLTAPRDKPTYNPDATSLRWLTKVKPTLPSSHPLIYDCTLGPGEVLFIGHQWWHATLNIGQTVFISTFI